MTGRKQNGAKYKHFKNSQKKKNNKTQESKTTKLRIVTEKCYWATTWQYHERLLTFLTLHPSVSFSSLISSLFYPPVCPPSIIWFLCSTSPFVLSRTLSVFSALFSSPQKCILTLLICLVQTVSASPLLGLPPLFYPPGVISVAGANTPNTVCFFRLLCCAPDV